MRPLAGLPVIVTIPHRPPPEFLDSTCGRAMRRRMKQDDPFEAGPISIGFAVQSLIWRLDFGRPPAAGRRFYPVKTSPCDAFMFSMSQWQGKSLLRHNIDRFARAIVICRERRC
jgi:hypothetical protein